MQSAYREVWQLNAVFSKWMRYALALSFALLAMQAQAATYSLPANIGSGPFSSCSLTSGTTYRCTGMVSVGNSGIINLTSSVTLNIVGNGFSAGNNVTINSNGFSFLITATEDINIGTNFTGQVSITASGKTINIGSNANITGDLTAGTLNIGSGSTIHGTCTPSNSKCTGGALPTVMTQAATSITATGATLNGTVSSNGASTTVTFDYGLTTSYGSTVTAAQSPLASGASGTAVSAALTGLSCNTTYHFRVKGVNSVGTANGSDLSFTTTACMPVGTFFPVPIPTGMLNQNITSWSGGSTYTPYMSGNQTIGGVPFAMQTSATGMDVVWGTSTSVFSVPSGRTYTNTVTLNTNLYGATSVYTLINTAWGSAGKNVGSITFNASNGDTYTVNLVEGVNVRDHYYGSFVNTVSASYVTTDVVGTPGSGAHLDMQAFALPSSFATEILSSIVFTTTGSSATGLPFLAGATVDAYSYGIDHVRLDHTGTGLTCTPSTVTVTACQSVDSNGSCTPSTLGISGNVIATNATGTVAAKAFVIPAGSTTATVTIADATAETVNFSAANYSIVPASPSSTYSCWSSASGSASCSHVYSNAGFIFASAANGAEATIPTQVAGVSSNTYYLRAVKTDKTTKACEAALVGNNSVDFGYECNNPTTCTASDLMAVNGGTSTVITRNNNGAVSNYATVAMVFDANGNAPLTFNYGDVGLVTLHARKLAGGTLLSTLTGSSSAFVVSPDHFDLTVGTAAPITAGSNFSATVTARSRTGAATANFGKETSPVPVTVSSSNPVPAIGNATAINASFTGFTGGQSTQNLIWREVGTIDLAANVTNYLGGGLNATGSLAGVGRFKPAYFKTQVTQGCSTGAFTYSGQPFAVKVTAYEAGGGVTANYAGTTWAKATTLVAVPGTGGSLSNGSIAASEFATGFATHATTAFTYTSPRTVPSTPAIRASDADGVTSAGVTSGEGAVSIRSGRISLRSAYGSELLGLSMPLETQFWQEGGNAAMTTDDYWTTNTADNCTVLNAAGITLGNYHGNLAAGETTRTVGGAFVKGVGSLSLSAPGQNNNGSVDVTINNAATGVPWFGANEVARATFGLRKTPIIYMRENF